MRSTSTRKYFQLLDRFGFAYISGLFTFLVSSVIWVVISYQLNFLMPFSTVWWLTGIVATLGFLLQENIVFVIFEKLLFIFKVILQIY